MPLLHLILRLRTQRHQNCIRNSWDMCTITRIGAIVTVPTVMQDRDYAGDYDDEGDADANAETDDGAAIEGVRTTG
jgi:hypothetical protein